MEPFGAVSVVQLGAFGVLLLVVFLLFRFLATGALRSKREVEEMRSDFIARLTEKDAEIAEWKTIAALERSRSDLVTEQNGLLIGGFATVDRALDALRAQAAESRRAL